QQLPAVYQTRLKAADDRPESIALALRLGLALERDAADAPEAATVYGRLLAKARDSAWVRRALDRSGRQAERDEARAQALQARLASETRPDVRLTLLLERGDCLARAGRPQAAAESYHRALELRPRHPRGRAGLERALIAASQVSELADLALSDLK